MLNTKEKILATIKDNGGYITTKEATALNIHRKYLVILTKEEALERIKWGLYKLKDYIPENELLEVGRIIPKGIICLESAVEFYNLSTFIPAEYKIAIQRNVKIILPDYPPVKLIYFNNLSYKLGIIEKDNLKIYNLEKTVCDICRYRNKLGTEYFLEVLKKYLDLKEKNLQRLLDYAKQLKIKKTLEKYLEILL